MALEKNAGINSIDFRYVGIVDITEESIEEQVEVFPPSWTG